MEPHGHFIRTWTLKYPGTVSDEFINNGKKFVTNKLQCGHNKKENDLIRRTSLTTE